MAEDTTGSAEPQDAVSAGRAATGTNTATGQAALDRAGSTEIPQGEDRGSKLDNGEVPAADYAGEGQPPLGLQKEPAVFAPNGALDLRMMATNSGPAPIAAVATSQEHAEELRDQQIEAIRTSYESTSSRQRLSDDKIDAMSAPELRAVAHDRGYDLSNAAGKRSTRAMFKQKQGEDESLKNDEA